MLIGIYTGRNNFLLSWSVKLELFGPFLAMIFDEYESIPLLVVLGVQNALTGTKTPSFFFLKRAVSCAGLCLACYVLFFKKLESLQRDLLHEKLFKISLVLIATHLCCMCQIEISSQSLAINCLKNQKELRANQLLLMKNKKLESNTKESQNLVYTFSHELKNALNSLLGNLSLAQAQHSYHSTKQFLSAAIVCSELLKNFLYNMLDTSKLENGDLTVSKSATSVLTFFERVWAVCSPVIYEKGLEGSVSVEKDVPERLDLDSEKMMQILLNLVSNAAKFTEKGSVTLHVSWETTLTASAADLDSLDEQEHLLADQSECLDELSYVSRPKRSVHKKFLNNQVSLLNNFQVTFEQSINSGKYLPPGTKGQLRIQVIDTGCGMTSAQQEKLFQKFSQVSQSAHQRKVGTGLGLWISNILAEKLGKGLKVRSRPQTGSVFELKIDATVSRSEIDERKRHGTFISKLPCTDTSTSDGTLRRLKSMHITPSCTNSRRDLKVLIADDDSFNLLFLKNLIKSFKIKELSATDGIKAVELYKQFFSEIGLVILDNNMPGLTGLKAAAEIADFSLKQNGKRIPIICVTGDADVAERKHPGITDVMIKPIDVAKMREKLSPLLA